MSTKLLITAKQTQSLQISPQLRQAINILQYTTLELDQYLSELLNENPLLEQDESNESVDDNDINESISADIQHKNKNKEFAGENTIDNISNAEDLATYLHKQVLNLKLDADQLEIANQLIYLIDEQGRLPHADDEILEALDLTEDHSPQVIRVLNIIQRLDPIGVASRNLRECFLVQITELQKLDSSWDDVYDFVNEHLDDISKCSIDKLMKKANINKSKFTLIMDMLKQLSIFPGREYNTVDNEVVTPELFIKSHGDKWSIQINDIFLSKISINSEYSKIIKDTKNVDVGELKDKLNEAKLVISSIKKRNETLLSIGKYIIKNQLDFLKKGANHIKSLNITDVASALKIHESTVSRAINGKYIDTPHGLFELKSFFPSYISNEDGSKTSSVRVKDRIRELIKAESAGSVLSDTKIAELLKQEGFNISRRTIVKYREAMQIASSYERSKILSASDRPIIEP